MNKIYMLAMSIALAMTLTQCKKASDPIMIGDEERVSITLDVSNGAKNIIYPETGAALFENGDVVYVANDGHYVGTLTYNQGLFGGDIAAPSESDYLHFYFMGNKTPEETLDGNTLTITVNISDQTANYPEIAYAPSTVKYSSNVSAYHARMLNKCALVKFNVTTPSNSPICITGMKNKVSVNLETNVFSYAKGGNGIIKLRAGGGEKWAILLPQKTLEPGALGSAYSEDWTYTGTRAAIPAISENGYLTTGITVMANTPTGVPIGATNGLFTINSSGDQVFFSKGNLQYIGSGNAPYWKFADNQWDRLGDNGQGSSSYNVDRDLFGWGCSGVPHGGICYQPWSTDQTDDHYYAYGSPQNNLYDQTGKADWGYNAISNGGNQSQLWRTLSTNEWTYMFNNRTTQSGIRYALGIVNGVTGLIVLPDNWDSSVHSFFNPNSTVTPFWRNAITLDEWTIMESYGAVFMPTAGLRYGTTVWMGNLSSTYGYYGYYWTSSCGVGNDNYAGHFEMTNASFFFVQDHRHYGCSVRLVQDYNP